MANGKHRAAVIFGKSGKIVIDDGFVAVASCDGRLEIVGDYCRRSPFKIQYGILAPLDQVFLVLRPYSFTVGIMTERKDGNKDFGLFCLTGHLIDNLKLVTGKVDVHLVCGIVLDMADDLDVKLILTDGPLEGRQLQTVRILGMILLEQSWLMLFGPKGSPYCGQGGLFCLAKRVKVAWLFQYELELTKRGYKVHLQRNDDGKVYGYSIKRGNSNYKSSVLGVGRNLTPSKIETTWAKLHPQVRNSELTKSIPQQTRSADITPILQPL